MVSQSESARPAPIESTVVDVDDGGDGDTRKLSTIDRYVILESIGMGGMGVVCAAYDPKLDRRVALKLLRTSSGPANDTARDRLFREAQALAKLQHPNVVTVHDVGEFDKQVYIAMEFVEGTTLREWLREEPRHWREIVDKFIQAGRGLAAAHAAGIIHRDFKPANVLLSRRGDVRVADFGVAKERDRGRGERERERVGSRRRLEESSENFETTGEFALIEEMLSSADKQLTVAGRMVGTPAYMAPEQLMGLKVGPFTDQYSFCVSFYEALYGKLPFEGSDRTERLRRMTEGRVPPPPKDDRSRMVPAWVFKVLARGLRPQATERWPSMDALLLALERNPTVRLRRWMVGGGLALAVTSVAAVVVYQSMLPEPEQQQLCQGVDDALDEHWNDEHAAAIQAAFDRSTKPFAQDSARGVKETLNLWAEGWRAQRVAVCEATWVEGIQSEVLLDLRMGCLDDMLNDLDALVGVLASADDEVVERSVNAAHALPQPRVCADVTRSDEAITRPLSEQDRQDVAAMEKDLSLATTLTLLHKFEDSRPLLQSVDERAAALGQESLRVRALIELADVQLALGELGACEQVLRDAITLAAKLDDPELEAKAWLQLMFLVGYEQHRPIEGRAWMLAARAAIERADNPPELRQRLEIAIGSIYLDEGELDDALEHFSTSLQLSRSLLGDDNPRTLTAMTNTGVTLGRAGRRQDGEALLIEALSRSRVVYGPSHPVVGAVYLNLGNLQQIDERYDAARESLSAALTIYERTERSESLQIAKILNALALAALADEQPEEAPINLERALAIFNKLKGETSTEAAAAHVNISRALAELERYAEAQASLDRAEQIIEAIYPGQHREQGRIYTYRCQYYADADERERAHDACKRALELFDLTGENAPTEPLQRTLEFLIEVEDARGRPTEKLRARLDEINEREAKEKAAKQKRAAEKQLPAP